MRLARLAEQSWLQLGLAVEVEPQTVQMVPR